VQRQDCILLADVRIVFVFMVHIQDKNEDPLTLKVMETSVTLCDLLNSRRGSSSFSHSDRSDLKYETKTLGEWLSLRIVREKCQTPGGTALMDSIVLSSCVTHQQNIITIKRRLHGQLPTNPNPRNVGSKRFEAYRSEMFDSHPIASRFATAIDVLSIHSTSITRNVTFAVCNFT
jgi:hypothetical protein